MIGNHLPYYTKSNNSTLLVLKRHYCFLIKAKLAGEMLTEQRCIRWHIQGQAIVAR